MLVLQSYGRIAKSSIHRHYVQQYSSAIYRLSSFFFASKSYSSATDEFWDKFQLRDERQFRDFHRKKNTDRKLLKAGKEIIKTPASKIVLSVLGNGKMGAPKSLLMTTTYGSYIFNVGESSSRVLEESKQRISQLNHAFFTHTSWRNIGGAVGLIIKLHQGRDGRLRIHGPPHVEKLISASRTFCDLAQLTLGKTEISDRGFEDTTFRFEYVPLYAKKENNEEEPATNQPKVDVIEEEEQALSVVFICKPKPLRRNMILQKCIDHGITANRPDFIKLLTQEKDVTLDDGTMVKANDVLDSDRGDLGSIVVIECPTESFVEALDKNERLQGLEKVHCVVHFTPCTVMATEGYQRWMKSLGPLVKHILLNDHDRGQDLCMMKPLENQVLMNHLHSDIFPLLYQQTHQPQTQSISQEEETAEESQTVAQKETQYEEDNTQHNVIYGGTNLVYKYREGRNNEILTRDQCPSYSWQGTYEQIAEPYLNSENMTLLKEHQQTLLERNTFAAKYPEVVFLGTGSSKPSSVRNVSGILVRLSEKNYMILDCGEGTYGQMLRFYGEIETARILRHLKAIYISHLHADHHMGVLEVLTARAAAMEEEEETSEEDRQPPYLLTTKKYLLWLKLIHQKLIPSKHLYRFVSLESLHLQSASINQPLKAVLGDLGLKEFNPVRVDHRQFPFGIILTTNAGYKMVYSGDTRPCDDLIRAGKNCDLLIHEATVADGEEAYTKNHSSFQQALEVGDKMRAKFVMLTHISQKYVNLSEDVSAEFDLDRRNYGIAFDNMRITPELLPVVASLVPVVKHLFAGISRTDYPPIIDEEIDILLGIKSHRKDFKSDTKDAYDNSVIELEQ